VTACQHVAELPPEPAPSTLDGCEDCLAAGTSWVHLRECLTCGKIACCDSSPQRHASKHAGTSTHPVIRSFEPGEEWRWCFVDQAIV
jgi:CPA1 family monovalent cation:H+ antiporter